MRAMKKFAGSSILIAAVMLIGVVVAEAQSPSWNRTALSSPFLIQINDAFFRQSAPYPRGKTIADGIFLFVDINILNNSDGNLHIPRFTLQDSRGNKFLTAIRARRSHNAIITGESLHPRVNKRGYLIFDVPSLSGLEAFPLRYKLQIENSRATMDVIVYKKIASE